MRIVYLITVGAFLLSIAIAQNNVPMGTTGQYNPYHQRLQRPIILDSVVKMKSEKGPLDWLFNAVSRAMDPLIKQPPEMIGPLNLPGVNGQVFIRRMENSLPWEKSRVVVKMVMRDPLTGITTPIDPGSMRHRLEDYSRRQPQQQYTNNHSIRHNNMQQGYFPSQLTNQHPNWQSSHRQRNNYHQMSNPKPFRASTPNDFRQDDFGKSNQYFHQNQQENYDSRSYQSPYRNNDYPRFQPMSLTPNRNYLGTTIPPQSSMFHSMPQQSANVPIYSPNWNDQRYLDSDKKSQGFDRSKADSSRSTEIPWPDYSSRDYRRENISNVSNDLKDTRFKPVIRNDRMVPSNRNNFNNFRTRETMHFRGWTNSHDSRGFRESPATKFQLEDVGGLEIVTAPNLLKHWDDNVNEESVDGKSLETDLTQGEDSMSLGNGQNLARGESAEHDNLDEPEIQKSEVTKSRLLSYKTIDRSHRSRGSFNASSFNSRENFQIVDRMDDKKNRSIDAKTRESNFHNKENNARDDLDTRGKNVTEVETKKGNLTSNNRWRFQERRRPTRIVKAIYRRRPNIQVVKNSEDFTESSEKQERNSSDFPLEH